MKIKFNTQKHLAAASCWSKWNQVWFDNCHNLFIKPKRRNDISGHKINRLINGFVIDCIFFTWSRPFDNLCKWYKSINECFYAHNSIIHCLHHIDVVVMVMYDDAILVRNGVFLVRFSFLLVVLKAHSLLAHLYISFHSICFSIEL